MNEQQESERPQTGEPVPMPIQRAEQARGQQAAKDLTGRQVYNLVTDTVSGPNLRLSDNLIQLLAVVVCAGAGAAVGALAIFTEERLLGAVLGAIVGLIVGVLVSGVAIMIYRCVRHARGKHD